MATHERFLHPAESLRTSSVVDSDLAKKMIRRGCAKVARKRARRYLAKRRLPKALWPFLAAVIFIAILFDRQIEPAFPSTPSRNGGARRKAREAEDGREEEVHPLRSETGAALNGEVPLLYRPPAEFQAKHTAQMIAFLIRNRGKLDNVVVREKWKHLDRTSMPLAIYLRDIEANDEWSALEHEIAACPFPSMSATARLDALSSVRHLGILELMPDWVRRGEDLLTSSDPDEPTRTEALDHLPDDDDTPPKPTRR